MQTALDRSTSHDAKRDPLPFSTAFEALVGYVLASNNARLHHIELATSNSPTLVYFTLNTGDAPVCVLPAAELSQRSIRGEFKRHQITSEEDE
jgi:hypothetical protein